MAELIGIALMRENVEPRQAARLAVSAVIALTEGFGPNTFYMPGPKRARQALRDKRIWEQWRGNNIEELQSRYDLSRSQIHRILAEQREINRRPL